jgi:hypothetical protein
MIAATSSGTARAQTCPSGCVAQARACLKTERVTKTTCRASCRQAGVDGLATCLHDCTDDFLAARKACRTGMSACFDTCTPPPPGPVHPPVPPPAAGCVDDCGRALGACATDVVRDARACLSGCRTAADHLACLNGCKAEARADGESCAATFRACVTECRGGSPSGAFVE